MTETVLMQTDLDRLSERVELAAQLVQKLREEAQRATQERDELAQRTADLEQKLQGQDVTALLQELGTLRREQKGITERSAVVKPFITSRSRLDLGENRWLLQYFQR